MPPATQFKPFRGTGKVREKSGICAPFLWGSPALGDTFGAEKT
jgi:hypothetical protein